MLIALMAAGSGGATTAHRGGEGRAAFSSAVLRVGDLRLVSTTRAGQPGIGRSHDGYWSPHGDRIAFASVAGNLLSGAKHEQILVKDLRTGALTLASSTASGKPGDGDADCCWWGRTPWSPDGNRIALVSHAANLVRSQNELIVKDLRTGAVIPVNSTKSGKQIDLGQNDVPPLSWSPDGTRIAFEADAQVYVKNLRTGNLSLAIPKGADPVWSPDINRIALLGEPGIVIKDIHTGAVATAVTVNWNSGNSVSLAGWSRDGTRLAFYSDAPNLIPGVTNWQVYVKDFRTGALILVSSTKTGRPMKGRGTDQTVDGAYLSPDGNRVAFTAEATNLALGVTGSQVYVKNLQTGAILVASANRSGQPANAQSSGGSWSADGRQVAFTSTAANLIPGVRGMQVFAKTVTP